MVNSYDFEDNITKKNPWLRSIRKSSDIEEISNLIKKRFEFPNTTGPYIKNGEHPADIVAAMANHSEDLRKKITPSIALILYKINENIIKAPYFDILTNTFYVVQDAKLKSCNNLVFQWLNSNCNMLTSNDKNIKVLYKAGLFAFANIQDQSKNNEFLWKSMWNSSNGSYWWGVAFQGLRKQNPKAAAEELPLLIKRVTDADYAIQGFWINERSRPFIEDKIFVGMNHKEKWAGVALNIILNKLDQDKTDLLLGSLHRKFQVENA